MVGDNKKKDLERGGVLLGLLMEEESNAPILGAFQGIVFRGETRDTFCFPALLD